MINGIIKILTLVAGIIILNEHSEAQMYVNDIILDKRQVFDTLNGKASGIERILNSLHIDTQDYYIEDEIIFEPDDRLTEDILYETERNLRRTDLFTEVRIEIDSVKPFLYDIYIVTQDKWSMMPSALFGTGGEVTNWGLNIVDYNLLGTGTYLMVEALNRGENDIGWQGSIELNQRRLFRSELSLESKLVANKYRTEQNLSIFKSYRTISSKYSYGLNLINYFGSDFLYDGFNNFTLMDRHERRATAWFSKAWQKDSRVFITGLMQVEDVDRGLEEFRRAFDNSGRVLIMFSSTTDNYVKTTKINQWQVEDLPVGGYGSATLGKVFPMGGKQGDALYYLAGQGERSYFNDNIYLFGQLTGASGFKRTTGQYTYQEFLGLGFYKFSSNWMIATRVRQQTVWNWNKLRQLILDNESGLRGYAANDLTGENRMIANLEFRFMPDWEIWIFKMGTTAFLDAGTVWNQDTKLSKTQWKQSAGLGLRCQNMVATGAQSIFRIDFAYDFSSKRFGGIVFTTDQMFSAFSNHLYKIPQLFGLEFEE